MNSLVHLIDKFDQQPGEQAIHLYGGLGKAGAIIPYRTLRQSIARRISGLRTQDVKPGARVVLPFESSEYAITTFLALVGMGALPLLVKPYLFTGKDDYLGFINSLMQRHRADWIVKTSSLDGLSLPLPALDQEGMENVQGQGDLHWPQPSDVAFIQFSSGTTAFPKGLPIRHDRLIANMQLITAHDQRHAGDICATWLPLYHDMGLIGGLLSNFMRANVVHLHPPVFYLSDPIAWLAFLSQCGATGSLMPNFGIDYALRYLRARPDDVLEGTDLSGLRIIYLGSEPINMDSVREFTAYLSRFGLRNDAIQPCYGMAEAVLMVSSDNRGNPKVLTMPGGRSAVCVGQPLESFSVKIVNDAGVPVKENELGEILLSGGTLADRYFEGPALTDGSGFYATGDLGLVVDGQLYIAGRSGDRIIVNGQNYFASALEQVLDTLPFLRRGRSAVFQIGDRIVVLAEAKGLGVVSNAKALRLLVGDTLLNGCGVKVNDADIHFVRYGQIEKTSSGKLRRQAIANNFEQGMITPTSLAGQLLDPLRIKMLRIRQGLQMRRGNLPE